MSEALFLGLKYYYDLLKAEYDRVEKETKDELKKI